MSKRCVCAHPWTGHQTWCRFTPSLATTTPPDGLRERIAAIPWNVWQANDGLSGDEQEWGAGIEWYVGEYRAAVLAVIATPTPATLDATRNLADEGLAGEPTTEAGRRLAEAIASLDERLPIDPGDAILAIEAEAADPLWRIAEAARRDVATSHLRDALAALDAKVEETP